MNVKKLLSAVLAACMAAMAIACTGGNNITACTAHKDADGNGKCDVCAADFACAGHSDMDANGKCDSCDAPYTVNEPSAVDVNYTVTVKDQDGIPMSGAVVNFLLKTGVSVATVTVDQNGVARGTVKSGDYRVTVAQDSLPSGYITSSVEITVQEGTSIEIVVENTIPDGTEKRPFIIVDTESELTLPANTTYFYTIYNANGRTLTLIADGLELVCGENTYTSENGRISFVMESEGERTPVYLKLTNKSDAEKTVAAEIVSPLGSNENPYILTDLAGEHSASVAKETTVYYKWTADKDGVLMLKTTTDTAAIFLYNTVTMTVTGTTSGKGILLVKVSQGDEVSIPVASTSRSDVSTVGFTVAVYAGTAADPIPVTDSFALRIEAGETYFFMRESGDKSIRIPADGVEVSVNGVAQTPTGESFDIGLSENDVVSVKNVSDERVELLLTTVAAA